MNPLVCPRCAELLELRAPDHRCCPSCGLVPGPASPHLLCLTGASGTGKSTVGAALVPLVSDRVVVLEQDVLWVPGLRDSHGDHHRFRSTWLRMTAMVGGGGRPVLLVGTVAPVELEELPERALFGTIHYLGLHCAQDVLAARLRARPAWRGWDDSRIAEMCEYATWLSAQVPTLDTTDRPAADVVADVQAWIAGIVES